MVTSDFRQEVEIAVSCMRHASGHKLIIGIVRSLWTWLWGRYHVPQNVFLVSDMTDTAVCFATHIIIMLAAETLGPVNQSSIAFFSELGRKIASISGDNREPSFLFQRISSTVQRFNSILLHNSFSSDEK